MQLNLREMMTRGKAVQIREDLDIRHLLRDRRDIEDARPLQVEAQAVYADGLIELTGRFVLQVEFICSRCLSRYCREIERPLHELFTQNKDKYEEDELVHLVSGDMIELAPYIEENVLLEIPFVPVCDENCRGLDSSGTNLNIYPEEKKEAPVDPRLAVLAELLDEKNND